MKSARSEQEWVADFRRSREGEVRGCSRAGRIRRRPSLRMPAPGWGGGNEPVAIRTWPTGHRGVYRSRDHRHCQPCRRRLRRDAAVGGPVHRYPPGRGGPCRASSARAGRRNSSTRRTLSRIVGWMRQFRDVEDRALNISPLRAAPQSARTFHRCPSRWPRSRRQRPWPAACAGRRWLVGITRPDLFDVRKKRIY